MDFQILKKNDFGILNPLQTDIQLFSGHSNGVSLAPGPLAENADKLPRLITFADLGKSFKGDLLELLADQLDNGKPPVFIAFLKANISQKQLATHLKQRLITRDANNKRMLLRFFDPRVLSHLRWMLNDDQLKALLGPIRLWTYRLGDHWEKVEGGGKPTSHPLIIDDAQHACIARIGLINRLQSEADEQPGGDLPAPGREIDTWLRKGQVQGLRGQKDLIGYAMDGLARRADFDHHPRIDHMISEARDGVRSYHSARRSLSESDWQVIASQLDSKYGVGRDCM